MANGYIGQVRIGTNDYKIGSTLYAVCSETGQNRTAVIDGFAISTGVTVHIKFEHGYTDTANAPTLTIKSSSSDSDALPFDIINANGPETWSDGSVISLTLTGTSTDNYKWVINSSAIDGSSIQNLSLGQITSAGKITGKASQAVVTNASAEITAIDLTVTDPDANGTGLTFIDTISQNSQGKITATKRTVQSASREQAGVIQLPSGTTTEKFLREDGTWIKPAYIANTDTKIRVYLATNSTGVELPLVGLNSGNATAAYAAHTSGTKDVYGAIPSTAANRATINSKTGAITVPGGIIGNASTATNFSAAKNIALTGDITGNADGGASGGWSISTTIGAGKVTNAMLAGSILPAKLDDTATIRIGTQSIKVGQSFDTEQLLTDLALSSAMHYKGEVTAIPPSTGTYSAGDVVTLKDTAEEYVYDGTTWRELGSESSYKKIQTAVSDPTVPTSGTTTSNSFIATITQNTEGVITVTKRNVPVTSVAGKTGAVTLSNTDVGLGNVTNHAQVTSITWSNNTLKQSISGKTATDIVTASTLKSAMSLNNVTNDAQIAKSIGTTKGDIIYFDGASSPKRLDIGTAGQVLTVSDSGIPAWEANASTDEKVEQSPYSDGTNDKTFNLLFKHTNNDTKETNNVYYSTVSGHKLTFNPKSGTLSATKFSGSGAGLTTKSVPLTALADYDGTGTKFLRQDGWRTVSVSLTSSTSTNDTVVTNVTLNKGSFPTLGTSGKAATFNVRNGVLEITAGSDAALSGGTSPSLGTISRATLGITGS